MGKNFFKSIPNLFSCWLRKTLPSKKSPLASLFLGLFLWGKLEGKKKEGRKRKGNGHNFLSLWTVFIEKRKGAAWGYVEITDGRRKGDFKFMARALVSLIRKSSKGLELFYAIIMLHGMYSFKPATTLRLVHTDHVLNELFMVLYHF